MRECLETLLCNITEQIRLDNSLQTSEDLISNYCGNDWEDHVTKPESGYSKKLVMRNDIAELYVITWSPNSESQIHDHPNVGCLLKVVKGSLQEDLFIRDGLSNAKFNETNYLIQNSIGFRSGNNVLHKITNINNTDDMYTVSIHIYSEPKYIQNKYTIMG